MIGLTAVFAAGQIPAPAHRALGVSSAGLPLADAPTGSLRESRASSQAIDHYLHLPLAFERRGVGANETWVARGQGYAIAVNRGKTIVLTAPKTAGQPGAALSLEFAGAKSPDAVPGTELRGKVNYIQGNDPKKWRTGLSTYDRVTYRGLYPGVDLAYYGSQQELEFDLVVKPGADPRVIRLKVGGEKKLSIDGSGDLMIGDSGLRIALPKIYQEIKGERKTIAGHYALRGRGEVGFEVDAWDRTQPLVIDPLIPGITASRLLGGGTGSSYGQKIALDSSSNIYVAGYTFAADFPTTNAAQSGTSGTPDGFITALSAAGTPIYSTYIGGSGSDEFLAVAVDSSGNAWATGYTQSSDFPTMSPTQAGSGGSGDAVVVALNPSGGLAFSTYLGGGSYDQGSGIAVDSSGNAYVTGFTNANSTFPTTSGVVQQNKQGSSDIFAAKYRALSGGVIVLYSTLLGGSNGDIGNAIAVDSNGFAYITGVTSSTAFVPPNPAGGAQPSLGGGSDAFVAKLNQNATALVYFTYLGGINTDSGTAITVDSSSPPNAYIGGYTASNTGIASGTVPQNSYAGGYDGFIAKLSGDFTTFNYVTYLGGNRNDLIEGLAIDGSSPPSVYVTGYTDSANFPTAVPLQAAPAGNATSLFQTTNSGTLWSSFDGNIPGAVFDVSPDPLNSGHIVAVSEQGFYLTINGGTSWTQQLGGVYGSLYLARSPVTPSTIYSVQGNGTVRLSTDNGVTWNSIASSISAGGIVADGVNAQKAYVFGNGSGVALISTSDGGVTWSSTPVNNTALPNSKAVVAMAAGSDGTIYAVTQNNGVYTSATQGASWTAFNSGLPGFVSAGAHSIAVIEYMSQAFVALAASGQVYFTSGGSSWSGSSFPNYAQEVSNFTIDGSNNIYIYAGASDGGIYSTNSVSKSWASLGHLTSNATSLVADPLNIGTVYAVASVPPSAFVAKLSGDGTTLLYSTYLGGVGTAEGLGVAVPPAGGQAYVTGYAASAGFPITAGYFPSSQTNVFVTAIADSASCSYVVNPTTLTLNSSGQAVSLSVAAPNGCAWSVTGNPNWTFVAPVSSSGTGVVTVQVSQNNTGSTLSGSIFIGGQTVTITQAASSCNNYTLDKNQYVVAAAGGSITANLTAGNGCPWAVQDNAPASIAINSGASGTGTGAPQSINLSVGANGSLNQRTFNLPVGNATIGILQYGTCVYTPATSSANNVPSAGVSNVLLAFSAPANCSTFPPIFSNQSWITFTTASDTLTYTVQANAGNGATARSGQITIGGAVFTINQLAPGLQITSGPNYGTYSVGDLQAALSATGGVPPYTWTVTSGQLPAGTSIRTDLPSFFQSSASAGIIGVTTAPSSPSPASFTLQVEDSTMATATQAATLNVTGLTEIDPGTLPNAYIGVAYSWALHAAGNTGSVTWNAPNGLPPGFSLVGGAITSNPLPTTTGFYSFTITATDTTGTVSRSYSLNIYGAGFTGTGALGNVTVGSPITPIQLAGQGGNSSYTFSGGLPSGLSISSSGQITGTPTGNNGTYRFNVTITSNGHSYNQPFAINYVGSSNGTVLPGMTYSNPVSDATLGGSSDYQFSVNGGKQPYTWSVTGSLPAGMSLRSANLSSNLTNGIDAEIVGAPLTTGTYNFTVTVTDSGSPNITINQPFTLVVTAMDSDSPTQMTRGVAYSFYLRPIGGSTPFTWSQTSGTLPSGVTLNSSTGVISGTPAENGNFNASFRIVSGGLQLNRTFGFNVSSPTSPSISAFFGTPPDAVLNQLYNYNPGFCCGSSGLTYSITSGSLPTGLNFSTTTGAISGTPTVAGKVTFAMQATDNTNPQNFGVRVFTINVTPIQVFVSTPAGNTGVAYSGSLNASGGTSPYIFVLAPGSALPPGITLSSGGTLSQTPTTAGQFNFTYTVTDNAGHSYTGTSSIQIFPPGDGPPITFSQGPIMGPYSIGTQQIQLAASGGTGTYVWSVLDPLDLPPGLALRTDIPSFFPPSATAGLIGVATTAGSYTFTLKVTSGSQTATQSATLTITPLTLMDSSLPDAFVGTSYLGGSGYQLTALNNVGTVSYTSINGVPGGMTLSSTGMLTGSPTTPGFYNINFTLALNGIGTIGRSVQINVYAVQITTPGLLPNAGQNSAYSQVNLTASGGSGGPYTFTSNGFPNGISMTSAGAISAGNVIASPGRYNISVTATDSSGLNFYTKQMSLDVIGASPTPLSIGTYGAYGTLNDSTFGDSYSAGISVNGGTAPYTWTLTGLPAGMSYRSGSGLTSSNITPGDVEIWGVASTAGPALLQATVRDFLGATLTLPIPFNVSVLDQVQLNNNSGPGLPNGTLGIPYSANLRVLGGIGSYSATQIGGQLPLGLTLNGLQITGTPLENGNNFNINLTYSDAATPANNTLTRSTNININTATSPGITINNFGNMGVYYVNGTLSYQLTACCVANYVWSVVTANLPAGVSPGLPPGINLSGNQLTGTFTTAGTYSFLMKAADQAGVAAPGYRLFTVVVNPAIPITFTSVPNGMWVFVDNAPQLTPFTILLAPGFHNISVLSNVLLTTGTQFVYQNWSDGGGLSHSITVGTSPATFTANYQTQYLLTTAASPAAGGSLSPPGNGTFYNAGSVVSVQANPAIGYQFANFSGGTLSGGVSPQNVTMNQPTNVVANFTPISPDIAASVGARVINGSTVQVSLTLTNTGLGAATNATITGITAITDVIGTGAVTVASGTPVNLGTINPGGSATGTVTFNWPATATRVSFTVNFAADGGYAGSNRVTTFY